jgi:hypothetical protein
LTGNPSLNKSRIPPNLNFEVDDFTDTPWRFRQAFDFVHARGIEGSVSDYAQLFGSAFTALKPGGYFEVVEATVGVFCDDETADLAPSFVQWKDKLVEASAKFGRPMGVAQNFKKWVEEAGFVEIVEEVYKVSMSLVLSWWLAFLILHRYPSRPGPKTRSSRTWAATSST